MAPLILQSIVQTVAEKLKQQESVSIDKARIRKAEEQYRILSTKVAAGKLQFDSPERRAAVLLWEHTEDVSWKQIGACIGVKQLKKLQQFHNLIKNYLTPQQQQQQTARRSVRNTNSQVIQYNNNTISTVYKPKLLPELVIRLSGFLFDPHGTQNQTIRLLQHLYEDVPQSASQRRGHLYDLQRYQAAYEAAALYHVAKTQGGCRMDTPVLLSSKKRKKDEETEHDSDDCSEDEHTAASTTTTTPATLSKPHHPLQLSDIMNLSTKNEYTYLEVKEKLPRIVQVAKALQQQRKQPPPSKRSRYHSSATKTSNRFHNKAPRRYHPHATSLAEQIVDLAEIVETQDNDVAAEEAALAHRKQILDEACERQDNEEEERSILLAAAANAILAKHGI